MARQRRQAPGGRVYHVMNRGVGRRGIFQKPEDYAAFERVLAEALARVPLRILGYCLMPNHWHFVLWPRADGELSAFTQWLTQTHTQRWHAHYHTAGTGHLYQGRFKNFPVQSDVHLLLVLRYVERNALRANLAARAEEWPWGSLWRRERGLAAGWLAEWPVERPADWVAFVNEPQSEGELAALRRSANRGCPFGSEEWQAETVKELGLESTMRPRGRPRLEVMDA
jgi:putative transposase